MQPHSSRGVEKRFIISIALTVCILIAEVIGGIWTGSLALLSDSAHVFMDIFALALSFLALRLSALPADDRHTYGWHRLEVLAALINGLTLLVIAFGIGYEAVIRFYNPQPIRGIEMLVIAVIGLVVNIVVAFVLNSHEAHHDLNVRSAFLHVIGDAVSSVGVIAAAAIISFTNLTWVDPVVSLGIGVLILLSSFRVLRESLHILVEGTPEGLSTNEISSAISAIQGIQEVHDLHIWNICSGHIALSAHIVTDESTRPWEALLAEIKLILTGYGIEHTTIQFEPLACGQSESGCGGSFSPAAQPNKQ